MQQAINITINDCGLKGTLPPEWGQSDHLTSLQTLHLENNQLTGDAMMPVCWMHALTACCSFLCLENKC